jgi:plastocyanin
VTFTGDPPTCPGLTRDNCDPATFDAALGQGACTGTGNTTFDEFLTELNPVGFGHHKWRFNPDDTDIKRSESLRVVNRGGEPHTFTEVDAFGAGCVAELNGPLGLDGPPAADCAALPATLVPAGATTTVAGLSPGTHLFECLIHPWMRTTVHVH